jgi:hypothetical protein
MLKTTSATIKTTNARSLTGDRGRLPELGPLADGIIGVIRRTWVELGCRRQWPVATLVVAAIVAAPVALLNLPAVPKTPAVRALGAAGTKLALPIVTGAPAATLAASADQARGASGAPAPSPTGPALIGAAPGIAAGAAAVTPAGAAASLRGLAGTLASAARRAATASPGDPAHGQPISAAQAAEANAAIALGERTLTGTGSVGSPAGGGSAAGQAAGTATVRGLMATRAATSSGQPGGGGALAAARGAASAVPAASGYNLSGIYSVENQPQTLADYAVYAGAGLNPSAAYSADTVGPALVPLFEQLGFTLMTDSMSGAQFWVGPLEALNPSWVPSP